MRFEWEKLKDVFAMGLVQWPSKINSLHKLAADVKQFSSRDMSRCNLALNNAIRKIFSFNRWESIRDICSGLGYHDLYTTFAMRSKAFLSRTRMSSCVVLRHLLTIDQDL